MITLEQIEEVRKKFKELYWKKDKDKFNAILIDQHITIVDDVEIDPDGMPADSVLEGDFFLKIFLFDMNDAEGLPTEIDGAEIKYLPTFPKKESESI